MTPDVIQRAAEYARQAHASIDQRRKFTGQPYIIHPEAVAKLTASVTNDPAMIAAAWLHDVVEDTPVTLQQIQTEFGDDIAALVDDLTKVAQPSDGDRQVRGEMNKRHTAQASPRAKTVKLADVIDNLSDLANAPQDFVKRFASEKESLLEVLTEGDPTLYAKAEEAIQAAKERLAGSK